MIVFQELGVGLLTRCELRIGPGTVVVSSVDMLIYIAAGASYIKKLTCVRLCPSNSRVSVLGNLAANSYNPGGKVGAFRFSPS